MSVSIDGVNGLTFNNGSTQAQSAGLGSSATPQTWQNMTASRALATSYTNSTGYPIMISIVFNAAAGVAGNRAINIYINGVQVYFFGWYSTTGNNSPAGTIIIPNGATYSCDGAGSNVTETLSTWWELR
jgi:hypothetical protein